MVWRCFHLWSGGVSIYGLMVLLPGPPSPPRHLRLTFQNQSTVELTWDEPVDLGGRDDLQYRVICDNCSPTDPSHPSFTEVKTPRQGLHSSVSLSLSVLLHFNISSFHPPALQFFIPTLLHLFITPSLQFFIPPSRHSLIPNFFHFFIPTLLHFLFLRFFIRSFICLSTIDCAERSPS